MGRYDCENEDEHRRQARDDFRWRGRPDYEMQDRRYDDRCAEVYMDEFRREGRREEERKEEGRAEEAAHQRAAEAIRYEEEMAGYHEQQGYPEMPDQPAEEKSGSKPIPGEGQREEKGE